MPLKKVSPALEQAIIKMYAAGATQTEIAKHFRIDQTKVSVIVRKAGVSRGKGNWKKSVVESVSSSAPAEALEAPQVDIESLREIQNDASLDASVRLEAMLRIMALQKPDPVSVADDGDSVDPFACNECQKLGQASWDCWQKCPFRLTTTRVAKPEAEFTLTDEDRELIAWAERELLASEE